VITLKCCILQTRLWVLMMCAVEEQASEDGSVGGTQALMSFVMGGYVTLVVNWWNTIR
jgi:hypothetical protein